MTQDTLEPILDDPRLHAVTEQWLSFAHSAKPGDSIGIIHHGDLDGLLGAAYAFAFLKKSEEVTRLCPYWVATDEYDFADLRQWLRTESPDRAALFDISIANNAKALEEVAEAVRQQVLVIDHHVLNSNAVWPTKVTLANPTPVPLHSGLTPVPTFFFANAIARRAGLHFPVWLAVLAMFVEGVDSFFKDALTSLAAEVPELGGEGELRSRYRKSGMARVATLLRAAFATNHKHHEVLNYIVGIAHGEDPGFGAFADFLEPRFSTAADQISQQISSYVDEWEAKLAAKQERIDPLVVIPLDAPHAVAGPVASILRGKFPNKVIASWVRKNEKIIVELRTGNSMPLNFVDILSAVSKKVHMLSYGGHPTAAGATISAIDLDLFVTALRDEVVHAYRAAGLLQ